MGWRAEEKEAAPAQHTYRVADVWADVIQLGAIFCVHGAPETANRGLVSSRNTATEHQTVVVQRCQDIHVPSKVLFIFYQQLSL